MNVNKVIEGSKLTLAVGGRLDTNNSPRLLEVFNESAENINEVVVDLGEMKYISSAGLLRVFVCFFPCRR